MYSLHATEHGGILYEETLMTQNTIAEAMVFVAYISDQWQIFKSYLVRLEVSRLFDD